MAVDDLALVRGMRDTRATLVRWNHEPWPVLRAWAVGSTAIALGLLLAVLGVAYTAVPDLTPFHFPGLSSKAQLSDVGQVLFRNSLVLALHAFACVAGFIAGSSMPLEARRYSGMWAKVHDHAGPLAILFVIAATTFSLFTQAYVLGNSAASIAAMGGISPLLLIIGILPHAIPELIALFLPLAAWIAASRRDNWHELLAATFVTTAVAAPMLVIAAFIEVYVSPHFILFLRG